MRERLKKSKLPPARAAELGQQIAEGLAAAHAKGIVNRDIKPDNLFLVRDGRVKILDSGLGKVSSSTSDLDNARTLATEPGIVLGTVPYMSPEQVRGQLLDSRSDIFSLGCVLFEMVTCTSAFGGPSMADTMSAILNSDPVTESAHAAEIPPALARIIRHCLEKDAGSRFQSAKDLAFELEAVAGNSRIALSTAKPFIKPRRFLLAAGAVALVAVGAFPLNGGAPRELQQNIAFADWTPDGKQLAITTAGNAASLGVPARQCALYVQRHRLVR